MTVPILPEAFLSEIDSIFSLEEKNEFIASLSQKSPTSIRINPNKISSNRELEKVEWSEFGYYLKERPSFTLDPLFHAGTYYVQEASSMFIEQILKQHVNLTESIKVLDLCAAPGGKSTHLLTLISNSSLLVSNEVIKSRAWILAENISKWGNINAVVTNNDPTDFNKLKSFFDVLVVDAPCSGEGMFRKDAGAIKEWSPDNVQHCAARQQRILADVWNCLKPGGVLIYSTCTYNLSENEANIEWLQNEFDAEPLKINIEKWPQISEKSIPVPGYHFYPHKTKGEGFFIAAVRKTGNCKDIEIKLKKPLLNIASKTILPLVKNWLTNHNDISIYDQNNKLIAFPNHLRNEIELLSKELKIVNWGTPIGEVKAKNILPAHELALSSHLNRSAFKLWNASKGEALQFLHKEDVKPNLIDKMLLVAYNDHPLGWLKNAGNRYNNLYPKEWRIRMNID